MALKLNVQTPRKKDLNNMTSIAKQPTHRNRRPRRPVLLYAVERARLRARRWKQWPAVEIGVQP